MHQRSSKKFILIQIVIPLISFLILLIIVGLILFYQLGFQGKLDFKSTGQNPNSLPTGQNLQIGLKGREVDFSELSSVALDPFEEGIVNHLNVPLVLASLDYLYIPNGFLAEGEKLCIQKLEIESQGLGSSAQKLIDPTLSGGTDLCFESGQNIIIGEPTVKLIYNRFSKEYIDLYQYPFDSRSLTFNVSIRAYVLGKTTDEKLFIKIGDVGIQVASTEKEVWLIENHEGENVAGVIEIKMTMMRHPKEKMLALAVLASLLMVLIGLPLFTNADSFWDAVGVLIGLWGIQEIIIPNYIHSNTIIRDFIGRIYLLIPVMIIFKLLKGYWENNLLPYAKPILVSQLPLEEIDNKNLAVEILSGNKNDNKIQKWAEKELATQVPTRENNNEQLRWARNEINNGVPKDVILKVLLDRTRDTDLEEKHIQNLMATYYKISSKKTGRNNREK